MHLEQERCHGLGLVALVAVCTGRRMHSEQAGCCVFLHKCTGRRMHLEQKRCYGPGMDAVVTVCNWNMYRIPKTGLDVLEFFANITN